VADKEKEVDTGGLWGDCPSKIAGMDHGRDKCFGLGKTMPLWAHNMSRGGGASLLERFTLGEGGPQKNHRVKGQVDEGGGQVELGGKRNARGGASSTKGKGWDHKSKRVGQ